MEICLSEATTLPAPFDEDVAACTGGVFPALEVWLTKLETYLESHSAAETRQRVADSGVRLAAAAYQGGLLLSQGQQRKAHFDDYRRRLELCQGFGIDTLLVVADFERAVDPTALDRAVVSLAQAGQWAAGFGVRLALEFRGANAFCSCLDTAITLVEQCREPNAGVCLDAFHFYKGPSKSEDLERLTTANLFHVQVCDVAGLPRELMTDADRIMPGEGDFRLERIIQRLRAIDYKGF